MSTSTHADASSASERSRLQQWAEGALAPHPHRLELRGSLSAIAWPEICAHCGTPATERIVVKKAYRPLPRRHGSASGGLRAYRISSASIPFCGNCATTHRSTVKSPSIAKMAMHLFLNPLIIPVLGFIWLSSVVSKAFPNGAIPDIGWFPGWGVYVALAAALVWCVYVLWTSTATSRLDPQTEITRACDFSENVAGMLERERRIYALSNKSFADRMAAMNADRVWTPGDQSRSMTTQFVLAILMLVALAAIAGYIKLTGQ